MIKISTIHFAALGILLSACAEVKVEYTGAYDDEQYRISSFNERFKPRGDKCLDKDDQYMMNKYRMEDGYFATKIESLVFEKPTKIGGEDIGCYDMDHLRGKIVDAGKAIKIETTWRGDCNKHARQCFKLEESGVPIKAKLKSFKDVRTLLKHDIQIKDFQGETSFSYEHYDLYAGEDGKIKNVIWKYKVFVTDVSGKIYPMTKDDSSNGPYISEFDGHTVVVKRRSN